MSLNTKNRSDFDSLKSQNRRFGTMIIALSCTSAAYFHYVKFQGVHYSLFLFILGLIVTIITLFIPNFLTPFTKSWFLLGDVMGKIVSPLVLGAIFYLLITPTALIGRLLGRDELQLKRTKANTYWIERASQNQRINPFKNQF